MTIADDAPPAMATPREVAAVLQTSEQGLAQLRFRGVGPPFIKVGHRRVLYRWVDVNQWMDDNRRVQTGDAGKPTPRKPPRTRHQPLRD